MTPIFVHGYGGEADHWDLLRAELPQDQRGEAVTLPGHGGLGGAGPFSIQGAGQMVADRGIGPDTVLVGHSMGCRVALEAAHQVGGALGGLVLIDGSRMSGDGEAMSQAVARDLADIGKPALAARLIGGMFVDRLTPGFRDHLVASMAKLSDAALIGYMGAMADWDAQHAEDRIAAATCPVLILQSTRILAGSLSGRAEITDDPGSPWFDAWAGKPNVQRRVFRDAGHFVAQEQPVAVAAAVQGVL